MLGGSALAFAKFLHKIAKGDYVIVKMIYAGKNR